MHGGLQDMPTARLNLNLPVQSKISTKDGSSKTPLDHADGLKKPDDVFGFKSPEDKIRTRERHAQYIDRNRKMVPMTRIPPDIIY
jgi:hypothetical protein